MSWFGKKNNNTVVGTTPAPAQVQITQPPITATTAIGGGGASNIQISMPNANGVAFPGYQYNYHGNIIAAANPNSTYTIGTGVGQFGITQPTSIISLNGINNKEIVRLNIDGSVTWGQDINVDEAAEAFARTLHLSAELAAGVNKKVKSQMRDTVFKEIIELAKVKGTLTLDDLTFMYEASKIMEKLKGGRE